MTGIASWFWHHFRIGPEETLAVEVKPSGQADSGEFLSIPATLTNANGLTDVCVIARCADKNTELGLNWIEFQP